NPLYRSYARAYMLIMPRRVEPCGINQLYARKYGTIPVVRNIGGLRDTVTDIKQENGYGFKFESSEPAQAVETIERAMEIFNEKDRWKIIRNRAMHLDFSWNKSADKYVELYKEL